MTTLSERLAELSGKATPGAWDVNGEEIANHVFAVASVWEAGDDPDSEETATAALIVELVNAYRAGRLIVKD